MKKLLLLVMAVMAFAGMSVAQDVWSVGYYTDAGNVQQVGVFKNNSLQYSCNHNSSYYGISGVLTVYNGDVYWISNTYKASDDSYSGFHFGKNNDSGYKWITSDGVHAYNLIKTSGGNAFIMGCKNSSSGVRTACFWREDDDDFSTGYQDGNGTYPSEAFGATFIGNGGQLYRCGYQYTNSSTYHGVIWKLIGNEFANLGDNTKAYDITYYDGYFYTVGTSEESGTLKAKVWKTDVNYGTTTVVYTLQTSLTEDQQRIKIYIDDAGDIYNVIGYGTDRVYKNGTQIYSSSGFITSVLANSDGVYYAGQENSRGRVWKNGSILYSPTVNSSINCARITDIYVANPTCTNSEVRSLPFFDGFENGNTSWPCWTTIDQDNNNGTAFSYWMRTGNRLCTTVSGDYCALHVGNISNNQEGWLISPRLFLQPGQDATTLTFKSWTSSSLPLKVLVYTGSSAPTASSSWEVVWSETHNDSWVTHTIDLSAYQGHAVYIAFKYEGTSGITWVIDDVSVTESFSPCSAVTSLPFECDFEGGFVNNDCWTAYDADMSGGQSCWQYYSSDESMYHPWGPSGVPQEGWLFSPRVTLPSGSDNYKLRFDSQSLGSGTGRRSTVWIALDQTGDYLPSAYTTMVWEDPAYDIDWTTYEVDLSAYKGHTVSVGFKYEGTNAHSWFVDNFSITQEATEYLITANANNSEWGTVSGGGPYAAGASCTLHATPASGYQFECWKKNGSGTPESTLADYTFIVTESATYTAYFSETPINYYTISTGVLPEGAGSVEGGGTFAEGSSITLTATASEGYVFDQWQDGNTDNPRTVEVTGNATYTAHFTQEEYTIVVFANPTEGGTVGGGGPYHYGETATLTATPASGYEFAGWSDGSNENPHIVTVTGDAVYTATFNPVGSVYYTVTVNADPTEGGTVTGGGTYEEGTEILLRATPSMGYVFDRWLDGVTSNPRTVTVTSNMTLTAVFKHNSYTITVNASPTNGGTVTGGGSYYYGDEVTLRATAFNGYEFVGWSDGSSENPHTIRVTGNATYTATFSAVGTTFYTVTTHVSPAEAGTVEGAGAYEAGTTITVTAVANAGYTFDRWNDGTTDNPKRVQVNNNMSFTAYFSVNKYTITVNASPSEGGTVTGGGIFPYGQNVTLQAVSNSGYEFLQWNDGDRTNPRTIVVTDDATYTAQFMQMGGTMYVLKVGTTQPELGTTFGSGLYPAGTSVQIEAFPYSNAVFVKWNDGNTDNPRTVVLNSSMSLLAEFAESQSYTIEVLSANPEMGSAFGSGTYVQGTHVQISAVPNSGYMFNGWSDGNSENPRTITVTGNATYTAMFSASGVVTHTVTLICNTAEGSVMGGGVYVHGSQAYIQATPNQGYVFTKWSDENTDNPRVITVTGDVTLVAFFGIGVDENEQASVMVYPNPAKESIRIMGIEPNSEVKIYNSLGELVKVVNVSADDEIGIRELASGLYVVRCGNVTLRFVKTL